jgi:hypothetical protein
MKCRSERFPGLWFIASTWRPRLGHGTVVGLEPYRGRLRLGGVVQGHIKTESGVHVRIVDSDRVVVLNAAVDQD